MWISRCGWATSFSACAAASAWKHFFPHMDVSVPVGLVLVKHRQINAMHGHREVLYLIYVFCHEIIESFHLRQPFILSLTPQDLKPIYSGDYLRTIRLEWWKSRHYLPGSLANLAIFLRVSHDHMTQLVPGDKVGMFSLVNPGRIPKFVIWGVGIFPFPAPTASWEYACPGNTTTGECTPRNPPKPRFALHCWKAGPMVAEHLRKFKGCRGW